MKFAEHLSAHITPEWRKQYILYEEMKNILYNAVERQPSSEGENNLFSSKKIIFLKQII